MREPLIITSPANPRVKRAIKLRKPRERRAEGVLLAEGVREVTRAAAAGLKIETLFVCPTLVERMAEADRTAVRELTAASSGGVEVDEKLMVKMCYRDDPEGVLAVVEQPGWTLAKLPATTERTLALVAVGTEKPGNLGAMVRTADAAGCDYVLAAETGAANADLFNPNAIRASTGAMFTMPVVAASEDEVIAFCRERGLRLYATAPDGDVAYTDADYKSACAIVIGPEDTGLSDAWLAAADAKLTIPMRGKTADSLNASNAAAVVLFEALRQRSAR